MDRLDIPDDDLRAGMATVEVQPIVERFVASVDVHIAQMVDSLRALNAAAEQFGCVLDDTMRAFDRGLSVPGRWMFRCARWCGMDPFDALDWLEQFPGAYEGR